MARLVSSVQNKSALGVESHDIKNLRQSFAYNINHIGKQFEKYVAKADHNSLSLNDFWHRYFGTKYKKSCPTTSPTNNIAPITTEIKMEDPIDIIDEVDESDSSDLESVLSDSDDFTVALEVDK